MKEQKTPEQEYSISGLYYKYGETSDEDIRKYLKDIKIVVLKHQGVNSTYGYYPLSEESMLKIMTTPRNVSLSFDAYETLEDPIENLIEYKVVNYLVKSTSRFFVKPDIGEIFDQIHWQDLNSMGNTIKAILYQSSPVTTVPDTEGEHFILQVKLLIEKP